MRSGNGTLQAVLGYEPVGDAPSVAEAALIAMSDSRLPQKRALFQALKGAATLGYYLAPGPTGRSPTPTKPSRSRASTGCRSS